MKRQWIAPLIMCASLISCAPAPAPELDRNSGLTHGSVQMNLTVGKTTKAEVLERFGAPNVTTRDGSGQETWSYQRAGQVTRSSSQSAYGSIILFGADSHSSGFESSSRMITLIIKFNSQDIVTDFKSRTSSF